MQNQNFHPWPWGQGPAPTLPPFSSTPVDQNPLLAGYQHVYGASAVQPSADYGQWTSTQFQQWQQWQQWQEKYQQWQAQYGKKYAESLAAIGQNPGVLVPGFPPILSPMSVPKPVDPCIPNPPLPFNAQPVPPPPPEEIKPPLPISRKDGNESLLLKENAEEISESEKTFDLQFKQWESEFEEWKKQNQDHPDKAQYKEYEKKWEAWREQLLQRLEQMRKKRLEKPNENKKSNDAKGKLGTLSDADPNARNEAPFPREFSKFDKPPPIVQPPVPPLGFRRNELKNTAQESKPGHGFTASENFNRGKEHFPQFDKSQEPPNSRFRHFEGGAMEGKFNQRQQRFGNFEGFPPRNFDDRNLAPVHRFPPDNFKSERDQAFVSGPRPPPPSKPKVPSLFDIHVEKPAMLMGPSSGRKGKHWEKGEEFEKKAHESKPWVGNGPWQKPHPSPWLQQWEVEKMNSQKPSECKNWEKEGKHGEGGSWLKDGPPKRDLDRAELSGYVGNILAKLGNVNVMPPYLRDSGEKAKEGVESKAGEGKSENCDWSEKSKGQGEEREDSRQFLQDVDDRVGDKFRREGKAFGREERKPGDRRQFFFDKGAFGGRFPREDVDERSASQRNGRPGRPFERFDRDDRTLEKLPPSGELVWKPQVFDYSQGRPMRISAPEEGFKISTVVDYSHGESKQTFDYEHGEGFKKKFEVKSFDYGHKGDPTPTVIDYGHGELKGEKGRNAEDGSNEGLKVQPLMKRSRSPKRSFRSRSRSPHFRFNRNSISPPFKNLASRNRDRIGRQTLRVERGGPEDKVSPSEGDSSKLPFTVTTVLVEDLICRPGRESRPSKLVFIMRGLPGSGKTYVTKLIKDKEVELGGDPPRILSLDDYFMTEVEKEAVDPETGRKVKTKTLEYEYEAGAEPHYRGSLVKAFRKTVSDGFFSFIIVDSVNERTKDYEEMWSFAKQKGFQVYVAEMDNDVAVCSGRNIHKRTEKEISELAKVWEPTPGHYLRLDVRSLLQSDAITEVEMEVVSESDLEKTNEREGGERSKKEEETEEKKEKEEEEDRKKKREKEKEEDGGRVEMEERKEEEDEDETGVSAFVKSRWDQFENSEQNLDRLDGLKRRREGFHATMEDYLQLPEDFLEDEGVQDAGAGKKRVRWADLEERKQQEKMRAIGFVVGQTDWSRMTDPTFGESALTRTKYI